MTVWQFRNRNRGLSYVESDGERIVAATPAYRWAVGMDMERFRQGIQAEGGNLYFCNYRPKTLGVDPAKYVRDRRPTDSELARRMGEMA